MLSLFCFLAGRCRPQPIIEHATPSGTTVTEGVSVTYTCAQGYLFADLSFRIKMECRHSVWAYDRSVTKHGCRGRAMVKCIWDKYLLYLMGGTRGCDIIIIVLINLLFLYQQKGFVFSTIIFTILKALTIYLSNFIVWSVIPCNMCIIHKIQSCILVQFCNSFTI